MATSTFWARIDNSTAANSNLNVSPGSATEITFTTIDPVSGTDSGDLLLEYNGGTADPDTWAIIGGVTYPVTVLDVGTVPGTDKNGKVINDSVNGQDIRGETVVLVEINGTRYFFFSDGTNTTLNSQAYMDGFPNGAFNLNLDPTHPPVAVCFARGTLIETPAGPRAVETLAAGDLVTTDAGPLPVAWIGSRSLNGVALLRTPELRPVRIAAGALGPDRPTRDIVVSPNHRVVVQGAEIELALGTPRAFCAAKHLVGRPGITQETPVEGIEYFHILFTTHRILTAHGLESESLSHGPRAREALGAELCDRLMAEGVLKAEEGRSPLPVLKRFEAAALA